jgi:hypothetical protein
MDEVTREWVKLHTEELSDLYCSPNIVWVIKSRRMRWAGHVVCVGERGDVGKHEGKGPLGRPRHRWEDNIRMDLQELGELGCGGMAGTCECVDEPSGSIKRGEFID